MPSEHPPPLAVDAANVDHTPSGTATTKLCTACNGPASSDPASPGPAGIVLAIDELPAPDDQSVFCATCSSRLAAPRAPTQEPESLRRLSWSRPPALRVDTDFPNERGQRQPGAQEQRTGLAEAQRADPQAPASARSPCPQLAASAVVAPASPAVQRVRSVEASVHIRTPNTPAHASTSQVQPVSENATPTQASRTSRKSDDALLDPLVDITRLRIRPRGYHCLYPGATFSGLQKSGKSSYDVTVTIVVSPSLPPMSTSERMTNTKPRTWT